VVIDAVEGVALVTVVVVVVAFDINLILTLEPTTFYHICLFPDRFLVIIIFVVTDKFFNERNKFISHNSQKRKKKIQIMICILYFNLDL